MTDEERKPGGCWNKLLIFGFCGFLGIWLLNDLARIPGTRAYSNAARAKVETENIGAAVDAYHKSKGAWPVAVPLVAGPSDEDTARAGAAGLTWFWEIPDAETTKDPFSPGKNLPYACFAEGDRSAVWSPGPDARYDLHPDDYRATNFDPKNPQLLSMTYDPTNGLYSHGDILRVSKARP